MKKYSYIAAILLIFSIGIQSKAEESMKFSASIMPGISIIDLNTNSSKFYEYRDMQEGFYLPSFELNGIQPNSGLYINLSGERLLWNDQIVHFKIGDYGSHWKLSIEHKQSPNRLSNKAMTPLSYQGEGIYTAADKVAILKDGNDSTGTPSLVPTTAQMAINDAIIADYLKTHLFPTSLASQRELTSATLQLSQSKELKYCLGYSYENRQGNRNTYGPIGDRPPRTLNIQLPEPIDYRSNEVFANIELNGGDYQANLNYMFSSFTNKIDFMRWDNIFFTPNAPGDFIATVDGTPRNVSLFGQRTLATDNMAHNFSFSGALNLPMSSRLTVSASLGIMSQDDNLLPYSFSSLGADMHPDNGDKMNWNDVNKLPVQSANAKMNTLRFDGEYIINPISTMNVKAYAGYFKLDNQTPISQWRYVTQDAAGTNGDVDYRNYRKNLAFAYDKLKFGVDVRQYINFWRTSIGVGFSRENINREFREANTGENRISASLRTRPLSWISLSANYVMGNRKSDEYNYNVTSQSYWYTFARAATQVDNPQFIFANHPDLRKYDVSDRKRSKLSIAGNFNILDNLDFSVSFSNREDDFDSKVVPVAPLANTTLTLPNPDDKNAMTPGKQLGLLMDKRQNLSANLSYFLSQRLSLSIFADRELANYDIRGFVYNENLRNQPSNEAAKSPIQLGTWTDATRHYMSNTEEISNTFGLGLSYDLMPGKLKLSADASVSMSTVDMKYSGYGSDATFLGRDWETFQFGFNSPGESKFEQYVINFSVEYRLFDNLAIGLHYMFNQFEVKDWIQEPSGAWVEFVEGENFFRDTSKDNRWGNRLIAFGSYLAPSYTANVGFVTLIFNF